MKTIVYTLIVLILSCVTLKAHTFGTEEPNVVLEEMKQEMLQTHQEFSVLIENKDNKIKDIKTLLLQTTNTEEKLSLMLQKDQLEEEIEVLLFDEQTELSKIRYLKGLQVVRILYEKVLSLDHHFASVRTLSEINKISNPNQYPEFGKVKEIINSKKNKDFSFDLTKVLGTNTIASATQTLINLFGSGLTSKEKETEMAQIECILDFTLRMHQDLNTIYYETSFLSASNEEIKKQIEFLFKEYTKPIGYIATLEECRKQDDWDAVSAKLNDYLSKVEAAQGKEQFKLQVNLEFPVDRLLQFINQYNNFIDEGVKFYKKFDIILNSYENEKQCQSKLPIEYTKLKEDIAISIEKFNVAYKPVEVNGTKLKEILYGLNEYE